MESDDSGRRVARGVAGVVAVALTLIVLFSSYSFANKEDMILAVAVILLALIYVDTP